MTRAALLTPAEAANELRISEKHLRFLTADGQLRYVNIGLGEKRERRRYDPADLDQYLQSRSSAPVSEKVLVPDGGPCSPIFWRTSTPPDAGLRRSKASYVYFIASGGKVKIGRARSIKARMNALQSGSPFPVHLIHYESGGERQERAYHKRFAAYRDRLEWFRVEGDLAEFLQAVKTGDIGQ